MTAALPRPASPSGDDSLGQGTSQHGPGQAAIGATGLARDPAAQLLARLGETLTEAARICHELAEVQLAELGDSRLLEGMASPPGAQPLLSVGDLAARLNIHPRTVRRWREEGKLPPALEIGGVVRWQPDVVQAWIAKEGNHG